MTRLRQTLTTLAAVTLFLSACGLEPQYGYVQSSDGTMSFRHPRSWTQVELDPEDTDWVIGIDASSTPSRTNQHSMHLDAPFTVAQVAPLTRQEHETLTLASLRTLALADRRDPLAGDDPSIRVEFHERVTDENGFQGHHMRFEVDLDGGTVTEQHYAVFDPTRARVHRLRVVCSSACFEANTADIEAMFDSMVLRP